MSDPPTGTVTFLFTDIEGSTRLLQQLGLRYADLLAQHNRILRTVLRERGGYEISKEGDAFFVAFPRAKDGLAAAIAGQLAIAAHCWPESAPVGVRMGLHTGEPISASFEYIGLDVHRAARICATAHGGQILLSQTTRDIVEDDLPPNVTLQDLGQHRLKDLARPQHLFQVMANGLSTDFPPPNSLDVFPNNLPVQLTSFIGREREIAEVKRLLATTRVLTLTGAGGAGKTRLALQVAADLLEKFKDGVWWVELAALSDQTLVPQTVASVLSVRAQSGRLLTDTLGDFLRGKSLLLLLDNCERLLSACAGMADALLRNSPGLCILATSREALGIAGEIRWRVPSMSLPDLDRLPPFENLSQYEAVRLFTDRVMTVQPTFKVTPRNAQAVAQICHRIDGIPLAIELAAARARVLAVEQIASRLDDRFRLLIGGSRMAVPRHKTLRAAMDWSYEMLSEEERAVLRRLSVFAGGFTLEAAVKVCGRKGVDEFEVLDLVTSLVDKSLVVMDEQGGEARYRLLETIRQYGRDKLLAPEEDAVLYAHRDWYLSFAERADAELRGANQREWLDRTEAEHDNLRAALGWSKGAQGEADARLRLAGALQWFWYLRGYSTEGRRWLEGMLSEGLSPPSPTWLKALRGAGILAWDQGDYSRALSLMERSLALCRKVDDKWGVALSLSILGFLAYQPQGDYERARALLKESLAVWREVEDQWGIAFSLNILGRVMWLEGAYDQAARACEESLSLFQAIGNRWGVAYAQHSLGLVARDRGDHERAAALHTESQVILQELGDRGHSAVALNSLGIVARHQGDNERAEALSTEALNSFRERGDKAGIALALNGLGLAALYQGDCDRAVKLCKESLSLRRELQDKRGIAECLHALACCAVSCGDLERGSRLLGAAGCLRESIHAPLPPADEPDHQRQLAAIRAGLGEDGLGTSMVEGSQMAWPDAVEYALGLDRRSAGM
jgi:predicted ATPase/class 3 adenylate cyclase